MAEWLYSHVKSTLKNRGAVLNKIYGRLLRISPVNCINLQGIYQLVTTDTGHPWVFFLPCINVVLNLHCSIPASLLNQGYFFPLFFREEGRFPAPNESELSLLLLFKPCHQQWQGCQDKAMSNATSLGSDLQRNPFCIHHTNININLRFQYWKYKKIYFPRVEMTFLFTETTLGWYIKNCLWK